MHAIVMAGGSGTRFWPLSVRQRPKQLLTIFGDKPMVTLTVDRLAGVVAPGDVVVVTGRNWIDAVAEALPAVKRASLIAEPVGRNTAPCIGLATHLISAASNEDPVIGVFAADHYVADVDQFRREVLAAYQTAADTGSIVLLGVPPTRPETGYGYVKVGDFTEGVANVERFVEKPDHETALSYLANGDYLWNAGLFFFRASTMLAELRRQLPELAEGLDRIAPALGTPRQREAIDGIFPELPSVSIDYGIMEGANDVKLVRCQSGWSDVGHWAALPDVIEPDPDGNVVRGDVLSIDAQDSVLINEEPERLLAVVGVRDIVVVQTERATLVVPRLASQRVKEVIDQLHDAGRSDQL